MRCACTQAYAHTHAYIHPWLAVMHAFMLHFVRKYVYLQPFVYAYT
jgi:hypothetical protein